MKKIHKVILTAAIVILLFRVIYVKMGRGFSFTLGSPKFQEQHPFSNYEDENDADDEGNDDDIDDDDVIEGNYQNNNRYRKTVLIVVPGHGIYHSNNKDIKEAVGNDGNNKKNDDDNDGVEEGNSEGNKKWKISYLDDEHYFDSNNWTMDIWLRPHIKNLVSHITEGFKLHHLFRYNAITHDNDIDNSIDNNNENENESAGSILMFSGGQTREGAGRLSEASSYLDLLKEVLYLDNDFLPSLSEENKSNDQDDAKTKEVDSHPLREIYLEEFARDSYENLIFSLCRFRQITHTYPQKVYMVGFGFKQKRFTMSHWEEGIQPYLPENLRKGMAFEYIPLNPELTSKLEPMELNKTIPIFHEDPHGCNPPLSDKRKLRDPFHRKIPYFDHNTCPELHHLVTICK